MIFNWDNDKNEILKKERGISFEQIVIQIDDGNLIDVLEHPNKDRYPNQIIMLINLDNYIYAVPVVIDIETDEYFMKTIYPSRKYTQKYLKGISNENE